MAQKLAFASGGSSSWADDDDLEPVPLPFAAALPKVEEQEPSRAASPRHEQADRRDRKYSSDSYDRDHGHGRHHHGGYADRGDRGGYRNERREERSKNPIPDHGPYRVFMGNLSFRVNEHDIVDFFRMSEAVTDVRVQREPGSDRSRGFAYVEFRDREALVEALKLDGENFDGRAVRLDVATENRKKSSSSFFEKRGDRSRNDRRGDEPRSEAPRERPRLTLQPRSAPAQPKDPEAQRKSIFGDAKPRDEAAFMERKKAEQAETKARAAEAKAKAAEAKAAAEQAKKNAPREPRERKSSHNDADARPAGGRGGRGRGERTERAGGHGRGGQAASAPQTERAPPSKKEEPKAKATEPKLPKATKLPAPAGTKIKNAFELLNADDSDSD